MYLLVSQIQYTYIHLYYWHSKLHSAGWTSYIHTGYRVHPLDAMLLFDFPSSQHPEGRFDYTGPAALWPVYVTFI